MTDIRLNYQMEKLESVQAQAALAVTGAWKGSNLDKLNEELGWEPLHLRRWSRQLTVFLQNHAWVNTQIFSRPSPTPKKASFWYQHKKRAIPNALENSKI